MRKSDYPWNSIISSNKLADGSIQQISTSSIEVNPPMKFSYLEGMNNPNSPCLISLILQIMFYTRSTTSSVHHRNNPRWPYDKWNLKFLFMWYIVLYAYSIVKLYPTLYAPYSYACSQSQQFISIEMHRNEHLMNRLHKNERLWLAACMAI